MPNVDSIIRIESTNNSVIGYICIPKGTLKAGDRIIMKNANKALLMRPLSKRNEHTSRYDTQRNTQPVSAIIDVIFKNKNKKAISSLNKNITISLFADIHSSKEV